MDREWLAGQLEAGRSMEDIAREVGKNPSTVAYWARKHGLASSHVERHGAREPIAAEVLADLALQGLSIRRMAEILDRSYTSVRHWLVRYGIETTRAITLADTAHARANGSQETEATCPTHGWTRYVRRGPSAFRCALCRQEAVARHRRKLKMILVEEAGSCCMLCGYSKCAAALQFHHVDPADKSFELSRKGVTISLEAMREEARKCVLLCANCHAEVEVGEARLPFPGSSASSAG